MSKTVLGVLLAISLVANVSILAGMYYQDVAEEVGIETEATGIETAQETLGLTESEVAGLVAIRDWLRENRAVNQEERAANRAQLLEVLARPEFDRAAFDAGLDARFESRRALFTEFGERFHRYLQTLPPDKRAAFLDAAKERGFMRRLFGRGRHARSDGQ